MLGADVRLTIPSLQQEIRRQGPDPNLMNALAQEYLRADLPHLASGWLERTLSLVADHEPALRARIEVERRLQRTEGCLKAYAEYLNRYPRSTGLRAEYARLLFRCKQYARAADELERILPETRAPEAFRRMLAVSYLKLRRYGEAAIHFRDLLQEQPSSEELLEGLVRCLESCGSRPTAIALVRKAIQAFPGHPGHYRLLSGLYLHSGEPERASGVLREALSLFPKNEGILRALAGLYRRMGNEMFAARFLAKAEALKGEGSRSKKPKRSARRSPS